MVKHRFYGLFHNILIPHRPHLNHHLTTEAQGLGHSDRANYLVFVACHIITINCCGCIFIDVASDTPLLQSSVLHIQTLC